MYDKASSGFSATIPVPRDKVNPNVYRSSIFSNQGNGIICSIVNMIHLHNIPSYRGFTELFTAKA